MKTACPAFMLQWRKFLKKTFGRKEQHYFVLKVPLMYLLEMSHAFSLSNLKIKFKKWLSRILSVWYFYIPTCTKHSQQSSPSIHPSIIHPHTGLRKGARRPSGSPGARSPSRSSPVGSAENMSPSPRGPRVLPPEHEVPIRGVVGGVNCLGGYRKLLCYTPEVSIQVIPSGVVRGFFWVQ